jgi:hypothetical protein
MDETMTNYVGSSVELDDGCTVTVQRVERGRVYGERVWPDGKHSKFSGSVEAWEGLLAEAAAEKTAAQVSEAPPPV